MYATRAVAKKYVDVDLSKSRLNKDTQQIIHPDLATNLFTPGELNILYVFRYHTTLDTYFDGAGNANHSRMQQLKKEIDLGLWDTYLFWDWEAFIGEKASQIDNIEQKVNVLEPAVSELSRRVKPHGQPTGGASQPQPEPQPFGNGTSK